MKRPGENPKEMLERELRRNERAEKRPAQEFHIVGGELEKIVKKKSHPARDALIWQNAFYGSSRRKSVTVPTYSYAENSPLFMYPELLDYVLEYIHIPKDVVAAYKSQS